MMLIGVTGKARAGKSTVAMYLAAEHKFHEGSFAKRLKATVAVKFNLKPEEMNKATYEKVIERWGMSFRQMLQIEGTEGGWQLYDPHLSPGPSLWVRHLQVAWDYIKSEPAEFNGLVIPDVRFPHEAKWLKEQSGVLLKIIRPGAKGDVGISGHVSEAHELEADIEIENDYKIPDLYSRVETLYQKLLDEQAVRDLV